MQPRLIVLAAGLGTRFGGAKQVAPFGPGGETLLELNAFDAISLGVRSIVVVTRAPLVERIGAILRRFPAGVASNIVVQEGEELAKAAPVRTRPWGTGHAVLAAGAPEAGGIVVNADDLYGREAIGATLDALGASDGCEATLAVYRLDRTLSSNGGVSRGVCAVAGDQTLAGIEEVHDLREMSGEIVGTNSSGLESTYGRTTPVSLNLWGLRRAFWPRLESGFRRFLQTEGTTADAEFRLPEVVAAEVAKGMRVRVAATSARWVGVTHADDEETVRSWVMKLFSEGRYPSPLYNEVGP